MKTPKINVLIVGVLLLGLSTLAATPFIPLRVACVGDSITFGYGVTDREQNSYPAQLADLLGHQAVVGNFGVSGSTLLKKGNKPYWGQAQYRAALAFQPDVVVIMLGTNDSKPVNWADHKGDYVANYVELIESFRSPENPPKVWICYPVPAYSAAWGISESVIKNELQPLIDQVATQTGVQIIDLYSALSNRSERFPDGIHPDADGAKRIAETICGELAELAVAGGTPRSAPVAMSQEVVDGWTILDGQVTKVRAGNKSTFYTVVGADGAEYVASSSFKDVQKHQDVIRRAYEEKSPLHIEFKSHASHPGSIWLIRLIEPASVCAE